MNGSKITSFLIEDDIHRLLEKLLIKYYNREINSDQFIRSIDQLGDDTLELISELLKEHGPCPGCKYC